MTQAAHQHPQEDPSTRDRILDAATILFADKGFDGVSTRELARAVGVSIATLHYHIGAKQDLYNEVVQRLNATEDRLVRSLIEDYQSKAAAIRPGILEFFEQLMNAYLDLNLREPHRARFYQRRWLDPQLTLGQQEREGFAALLALINDLAGQAKARGEIRKDLDIGLMVRGLEWLLYGYLTSGGVDPQTWQGDPTEPSRLAAFRTFLKDYLKRMTAP